MFYNKELTIYHDMIIVDSLITNTINIKTLKEKYPKLEEIKGERIIRHLISRLLQILQQVKRTYIRELTGMKVNFITEDK